LTDPSKLKVANTPNTQFLLQAELRAIKDDHEYIEIETSEKIKFRGYLNAEGDREGVGIRIF
jgi:hypothetical protein